CKSWIIAKVKLPFVVEIDNCAVRNWSVLHATPITIVVSVFVSGDERNQFASFIDRPDVGSDVRLSEVRRGQVAGVEPGCPIPLPVQLNSCSRREIFVVC